MNKLKLKSLLIIILTFFIISCSQSKTESKNENNNENKVLKTPAKKKQKKDKTKKNTIVTIDATIEGNEVVFDQINPKYSNLVVLFNDLIQLKYTDIKNQVVLVHLHDVNLYKSTPIIFTQQIAALPPKEQVLVKVKGSKLSFSITNNEGEIVGMPELYQGEVILKEFTEERIVILFEGEGFPVGVNNGKSKLFHMKEKIVIENYNTYDSRR